MMTLFILTIFFSIIFAEYQEGEVNLSQLQNDGIAFLGHWMFDHNPGNGTYIDFNQHIDKFKAGQVEITMKLSNPSSLTNGMRIAAYSDFTVHSWEDLVIIRENMCNSHSWYSYYKPMNKISHNTWTYTLTADQHIIARWWWLYLINCNFKYNADLNHFINTDIHYKLHWKQANDDDDVKKFQVMTQEISSNELKQPLFSIIAFAVSLLSFLMFCYSCYVYKKGKKIMTLRSVESSTTNHKITDSETINEGKIEDPDYETLMEMRPASNSKMERMKMKIFSLILVFYVFHDLFIMAFWLNLSFNGYKRYSLYLFAMIFQSIVTMLFCGLFLWLFSFQKNKTFMIITYIILSAFISIFELILNIYWYNNYVLSKEDSLYRYDYHHYFALYGWIMLFFGFVFVILYGYNHHCRCNKETIIAAILILLWFSWQPFMLFVDFCNPLDNFEDITWWNLEQDFITDVVSWTLRFVSIIVFLVSLHPLNRYRLNFNTKQIEEN